MRARFNSARLQQRVTANEVYRSRTGSSHVRRDGLPRNCQYCANSIEETYYEYQTGDEVGRVHYYENPDGTIGASGRPDPKFLVEGRIEYHLAQTRQRGQLTPKQNPIAKRFRKLLRRLRFEYRTLKARWKR
jgi:hypothetical protein